MRKYELALYSAMRMRERRRYCRCQRKNSWQSLEKTMVMQVVPLQKMEVHSRVDINLQPMKDSIPKQGCA